MSGWEDVCGVSGREDVCGVGGRMGEWEREGVRMCVV